MGSFKATKNTVALKLPIPPKPLTLGRSTSQCGKTSSGRELPVTNVQKATLTKNSGPLESKLKYSVFLVRREVRVACIAV
jgi:hypothetical protein